MFGVRGGNVRTFELLKLNPNPNQNPNTNQNTNPEARTRNPERRMGLL
jgi:hypothetical protein